MIDAGLMARETCGMNRLQRIEKTLQQAFAPEQLNVQDDSARHAGHAGARPGGETHYSVRLVSKRLEGLTRIERHRLIHDVLKEEFSDGLHALQLELKTPAESH